MEEDNLSLTDENFKSTIETEETPVLVDFWAPWCGPCQMLGPVIHEVAEALEGKAKVYKVDIDKNQKVAGEYEIRSIPTIMVFLKGEIKETLVGVQSKENYINAVSKYLKDDGENEA